MNVIIHMIDLTLDQRTVLERMMARWENPTVDRLWQTEKNTYVEISTASRIFTDRRFAEKRYWKDGKWKKVG